MKKIGISLLLSGILAISAGQAQAGDAPAVFKKCQSCHKTDADNSAWTMGPGLKGIGKRTSKGYLKKMLKDPQGTFDAGGPEIEAIKAGAKFKSKLQMPKAVQGLTEDNIKALVEYLMAL
jgi:cytochrome c553